MEAQLKKSKKEPIIRKDLIKNLVILYVYGSIELERYSDSKLIDIKKFEKFDSSDKYDLKYFNGLEINRAQNSCGIREIDSLQDTLDELFESNFKLNKAELELFFQELKDKFIKYVIDKDIQECKNGAFYTVSLTKRSNSKLIEIMDELADLSTDWRKNPNSGNLIKLWIFNA